MHNIMTSLELRGGTYNARALSDELALSLCWLAFLVTADWHLSVEVVCSAFDPDDVDEPFSRERVILKSRRLVASAAVGTIKAELPESARRTERALATGWTRLSKPLSGDWSRRSLLSTDTLQRSLLAVDIFPRCALLLIVFEGLPIEDAALLLGENEALVRAALGQALLELTQNLLGQHGWNRLLVDCRN